MNPIVVSIDTPPRAAHSDAPGAEVTAHDAQAGILVPTRHGGDPADRVRMRKPVEPEALQRPSRTPLGGERVRRGGGGHRRVEPGVEAGDRRKIGAQAQNRAQTGERPRLVQRRERRERRERFEHRVVDADRAVQVRAAVYDPVATRIDGRGPFEERPQLVGVVGAVPTLDVVRRRDGVAVQQSAASGCSTPR